MNRITSLVSRVNNAFGSIGSSPLSLQTQHQLRAQCLVYAAALTDIQRDSIVDPSIVTEMLDAVDAFCSLIEHDVEPLRVPVSA